MFRTIGVGAMQRPQTDSHSRRARLGAIGLSTFLVAGLVATVSPGSPVAADGGEYKLDFTAAAPETYDHETGGGAFNDRTVGVDKDIVESLEGGQFECLDIVTYLTQIRRDETDPLGDPERLVLNFSFLADTTGQSGVALVPPPASNNPRVNSGNVQNGDLSVESPPGSGIFINTDSGNTDSGQEAVVTGFEWSKDGDPFTKAAETLLQVSVDGMDPGDRVVLRVDVLLACDTPKPTGNLQAALVSTAVVNPDDTLDTVPQGEQTVPFKQVGDIYPVACPEQDDLSDPVNDPSCNPIAATTVSLSTEQSTTSSTGSPGGGKPVVGTVTKLVGTNPQVSSMFAVGGLIGLVALRRRSATSRRSTS